MKILGAFPFRLLTVVTWLWELEVKGQRRGRARDGRQMEVTE